MWEYGISAYVGLGHSLVESLNYLKLAHSYGYTRLFTSLHIPEANEETLLNDIKKFISSAAALGFSITADISPRTLSLLGASFRNLSPLTALGLSTLRIDYGFSPEEIAQLSLTAIEIELNASTATHEILQNIIAAGTDIKKLRACHNYYPRPDTGLSFNLFAERSQLFRAKGIPVLAFIPSKASPRAPIFAGLPTLEKHRGCSSAAAAKELLASKLLDGILFGDPSVAEKELSNVAALDPDIIELAVVLERNISAIERHILFDTIHTNRLDPGEHVLRSQESRNLAKDSIIPRSANPRSPGTVTIDNQKYLRYMGEMQIVLTDLPADERVNTAASIIPEELPLLKFIGPGQPFRLKEYHHEA
ncbi:MAG: MupG family TIM beta-alpha barrel fold protein [Pelosinus sp.]|nr:MupG family TIM beta-alpha barrel fold protein [Pelosinus sp.]